MSVAAGPVEVEGISKSWGTVDSQYGVVRIACSQPISRLEYVLGKWMAVMTHVAIFAMMLSASEWTPLLFTLPALIHFRKRDIVE